jgi:spermidine/putrescine-binding protein
MLRNFKVLLALLAVIVIAGSAYAFAAANTVPATNAGYVASVVSGYTVDNIVYDLDDDTPTNVAKITFDINPDSSGNKAAFVQIQTTTGGTWTTCNVSSATDKEVHAVCTPASTLAIADVIKLNVVASESSNPAD